MSYNGNLAGGYCAALQQVVIDTCVLNPQTAIGFTQAVWMAGLMDRYNPFNLEFSQVGGERQLQIKYSPRNADTTPTNTIGNVCAGGGYSPTFKSQTIEANLKESVSETFSIEEVRALCDSDFNNFKGMRITKMFDALNQKINKSNLALLNTITPYTRDHDSGTIVIDPVVGTPGGVNAFDFYKLRHTLEDIGCSDTPFIISGNHDLQIGFSFLKIACCNSGGQMLNAINDQFLYFKDHNMSSALGADVGFAFVPGAFRILPWYRNVGAHEYVSGEVARTRILDPRTNMYYDLDTRFDACTGMYTFQISLNWAFWSIPDDFYLSTDALYQTKGFVKLKIT